MNTKEIFDYWQNAMALSSKSVFANLEHYLIESGEVGLGLLNANSNLLSPVLDVQKLTLEMKNKVSAIENKKYFFKLAEAEMAKAMHVLRCKFDQTYRLLVQLGMDVSGWTMDNFFDKLKELDADVPEEPTPEDNAPEAAAPKVRKSRKK